MLALSGCANPYAKFYQDRTGGIDITKAPSVQLYNGEPKLFNGQNPDADGQKMQEDGFVLVGISSFNGANVSYDKSLSKARDVHAEVVLCYSKYSGTNTGVMPLTLPNNQTSTTTMQAMRTDLEDTQTSTVPPIQRHMAHKPPSSRITLDGLTISLRTG
jgi:hypothetical protein